MNTLVLSVPIEELARSPIPASVFDAEHLRKARVSVGLRRALHLVQESIAPRFDKIVCVARPEIFTHGVARAWLDARIEGAREHLALSNGHVLKSIDGLQNTVFVYGLDQHAARRYYRTLLFRAPQLLGNFARQINGTHPFGCNAPGQIPDTLVVELKTAAAAEETTRYYPLYWNRHSEEDSAERMLGWGRSAAPSFDGCERLTMVLCTDAGLHDANFCHSIAAAIADAAKDPALGVLIALPSFDEPAGTRQRLSRFFAGLACGGVVVPRTRLNRVIACTEIHEAQVSDLDLPFDLLLHDSFPLWSYTREFYATAATVAISRSKGVDANTDALALERALMGREPRSARWSTDFLARMGLD